MKPGAEKKRLFKLVGALVVCVAAAGILQPWKPRAKRAQDGAEPTPTTPADPSSSDTSAVVEGAAAEHPTSDAELAAFVAIAGRRQHAAAPESRAATTRDPFLLTEEAAAGRTLQAIWRTEDERRASSRIVVVAEAPATRPAVEEAVIARIRGLKLLGVVGGADGGVALIEGLGRIRVGDPIPDSPFRLASVRTTGASFRAGEIEIELLVRRLQGGVLRSEKQ